MSYAPGAYKLQCQRCGFDLLSTEAQFEPQTEKYVCPDCFDAPHPIDTGSYPIGEDEMIPPGHQQKPADILLDPLDGNGSELL